MSYDYWRLMNEEEDRAHREAGSRSWEEEVEDGNEPDYEPGE